MLDRFLSALAPHICSSCGAENALLCEYCFYDIIERGYDQCIVCLRPTPLNNVCRDCRPNIPFDDAWVVGERSEGLKELIDRYKFDRATEGARVIARLLSACLPVLPHDTVVTFVPSIARHRRQRGYDHMERIAVELARLKSVTVLPLLDRQTSLPQRDVTKRSERLTRQRGAFSVEKPIDAPVVLVDDIYTTGATITAGVEAIRARSNAPIFVAIVARQPFDR